MWGGVINGGREKRTWNKEKIKKYNLEEENECKTGVGKLRREGWR